MHDTKSIFSSRKGASPNLGCKYQLKLANYIIPLKKNKEQDK